MHNQTLDLDKMQRSGILESDRNVLTTIYVIVVKVRIGDLHTGRRNEARHQMQKIKLPPIELRIKEPGEPKGRVDNC